MYTPVIIVQVDRSKAIKSEQDRDVSLSVAVAHALKRIACRVASMHLLHLRLAGVLDLSHSPECFLTVRPSIRMGAKTNIMPLQAITVLLKAAGALRLFASITT